MKAVICFLPHLFPLAMFVGFVTGTSWTSRLIAWLLLVTPFLDHLFGPTPLTSRHSQGAHSVAWKISVWTFAPAHGVLVCCGLFAVVSHALPPDELIRAVILPLAFAVGATGGLFGVPVAHELLHQRSGVARLVAKMQMLLLSYPHFCIEHTRGHHRNVATPADPATARLGESIYAFYPRAVWGSLAGAWALECDRVRRFGLRPFCGRNAMVRYGVTLVLLYAAISFAFGWPGLLFFALQSIVGFSSVEVINYIEHYGLTRREIAPGCYEDVTPQHAWNSSHRITNLLMFNLAYHSDHHCDSRRPYPDLRQWPDAPQLPGGYFAMFTLALVPPLWRRMMDPRVEQWSRVQRTDRCEATP